MESTVNKYKQTYDHLLGANIDHLLHFLDSADYNIDYLVLRSATWPPNYSPHGKKPAAKKGIMGYGGNAFAQAMGVFDVLRLSLVSVKDIDTIMSSTDLDDTLREALPSSLWSSSERWETCTDLFEREGYEYESLVKLLYDVLDNFQKSDSQEGWPNGLEEKLAIRKHEIDSLKLCTKEYKDTIIKALDDIFSIKLATEDTLNTGTSFDFSAFEESYIEDLKAISATGSWLHANVNQFYSHDISMLQLAEDLLSAKTKEDIIRHMNTVLFKTDLDAVFKLRTETQGVKTDIQNWILSSFGAMGSLVDFFEKAQIESKIRNLTLWRQPVMNLRSHDVLQYSYDFDETWQTWPISVPLRSLVTSDGSKYISDIFDISMAGINEALYDVQHTSLKAKEDAVMALDILWTQLQSHKLKSVIEDNFVR